MTYPYAKKMGSLRDFLVKIPSIAVPEKITQRILYALGYKTTNDRPIITVLKFIGFLDGSGKPTANYVNFRSKGKSGAVMASCLKSAYKDLFGLYEEAYQRTNDELRDFFSTRVTGGDLVLNLTVNTFKTLCEFADFEAVPVTEKVKAKEVGKVVEVTRTMAQKPTGVTINLNIQLTLPATEDATVYDKIFKALKENLLS